MKRSGDRRHHRWSPAPTLNGCDWTSSTLTQSSEQECSYLKASKRHPSTPYCHNPSKAFLEEPGCMPSRDRQNMLVLVYSQHFSKICWRGQTWSVVLLQRREPHWVSPSFGSVIFVASWHALLQGDWAKRSRGSWFIHSCFPFCVWGWLICHSFGALPKRHSAWHTWVSQIIRRSRFP